jgi:uncharacterized protein with NRDE domain
MIWFSHVLQLLIEDLRLMCLIAIAYRAHPDIRLLVLGNRDEFHERPTAACDWWGKDNGILSGRDLQAGGTWLGVNKAGRFAAVTNYRETPSRPGQRSRGELPLAFLNSKASSAEFCQSARSSFDTYGGFNLLMDDGQSLAWVSNRDEQARLLEPGIHAVSNHLIDSNWPKVREIRSALEEIVSGEPKIEDCLETLGSRRQAEDSLLPDTGVGVELERFLSPALIVGDNYGTRSSSVLIIREDGAARLTEVSHDRAGNLSGRKDYRFNTLTERRCESGHLR